MTEDKPLWGSRFSDPLDPLVMRFTATPDGPLLPYELAATKAHAQALVKAGLLTDEASSAVGRTCDEILARVEDGSLSPAGADEDVHSFVERLLTERLGETGRRIHAGRSRNDLVATDLRLWCRDAATGSKSKIADLLDALAALAAEHATTVMPGYTHLQRAQPVSLGFHLAAHGFAFARDGARFESARHSSDVSSMGAGALAGTTLPIDPGITASELGFSEVFHNAMDAVADRDFVCDLAYAAALCCVHLSRLGEEIVLWTSSEFAFARPSDGWSTGSSMMPQKRNPDVAELVRGRAAPAIGDLNALLILLKGLPLAYNRDLQEDKELIFRMVERTTACLAAMAGLLGHLAFDPARLQEAAAAGGAWATDLAEQMVERGVPFRDAHEHVGRLVARHESSGTDFDDLDAEALAAADDLFRPGDATVGDPLRGIERRSGPGGTAPDRVREQANELRGLADELRRH